MVWILMVCMGVGNLNMCLWCVMEMVNGLYYFIINGYLLVKGMGVGKYIVSECFFVGGYQWVIYFYFDGKNVEDNLLYVLVFIVLVSEGMDVWVFFELMFLDQSGKVKYKVYSYFDCFFESGLYMFKYWGSMWGYK